MSSSATMSNRAASAGHPAPARGAVRGAALWFGIFGGPAAWSVQTLVNLPVASHGCFPRMDPLHSPVTSVRGIAFFVSIGAIVVCLLAGAVAGRSWSRSRAEHHRATGQASEHEPSTAAMETGEGRTRFMALCGILTSMIFLVLAIVHTASILWLVPCAG
ncbi:MAG TPA: hypothetical protein VHB25_00755 [Gemmatimonadaceae bacterium]|nr:hypothetical protein [Gemmatimonadaceae bacterium]